MPNAWNAIAIRLDVAARIGLQMAEFWKSGKRLISGPFIKWEMRWPVSLRATSVNLGHLNVTHSPVLAWA
jgi:hypothetical protein